IEEMSSEELVETRKRMARQGMPTEGASDDQLRAAIKQRAEQFRDNAPVSAAQAATVILDGVRNDEWRILIGEDAKALDERVRANPLEAYEPSFVRR
ncbi:MAG: short-chain dehydrogenase, partial [Chloroflexi bacterium]|nr:short-chain dehydrogenase [Chloroflexota bacterium]